MWKKVAKGIKMALEEWGISMIGKTGDWMLGKQSDLTDEELCKVHNMFERLTPGKNSETMAIRAPRRISTTSHKLTVSDIHLYITYISYSLLIFAF